MKRKTFYIIFLLTTITALFTACGDDMPYQLCDLPDILTDVNPLIPYGSYATFMISTRDRSADYELEYYSPETLTLQDATFIKHFASADDTSRVLIAVPVQNIVYNENDLNTYRFQLRLQNESCISDWVQTSEFGFYSPYDDIFAATEATELQFTTTELYQQFFQGMPFAACPDCTLWQPSTSEEKAQYGAQVSFDSDGNLGFRLRFKITDNSSSAPYDGCEVDLSLSGEYDFSYEYATSYLTINDLNYDGDFSVTGCNNSDYNASNVVENQTAANSFLDENYSLVKNNISFNFDNTYYGGDIPFAMNTIPSSLLESFMGVIDYLWDENYYPEININSYYASTKTYWFTIDSGNPWADL